MKQTHIRSRILTLALSLFMVLAVAAPALAANISVYGTIAADTTVYSSAAKTTALGTFKKGEVVAIETQTSDGTMYVVRLGPSTTSTGYIAKTAAPTTTKTAVLPTGKTVATMTASSSTTPATTVRYGEIYNVSKDVNFRVSASSKAALVTGMNVLTLGQAVTIVGESGSYYKLTVGDKTGYVDKKYVKISAVPTGATIVNAATKLYTEASTTSKSVVALAKGAEITILQTTDTFYKAKFGTKEGFVEKTRVTTLPGTVVTTGTALINASSTKVYKLASNIVSTVTSLSKGVEVTLTGTAGNFYKVKSGAKEGFVEKARITLLPTLTAKSAEGTTNVKSVKMYKSASTIAATVTTIGKIATPVAITGEAGDFYQVLYSKKTGYIEKSKVTVSGSSSGSTTPATGKDTGTISVGKTVKDIKVQPSFATTSSTTTTGLAAAKKINAETIGYINVGGTNLQQPILYRKDYNYYDKYNISKSSDSKGAVHAIYGTMMRNNTVTGHNMRGSNAMFHQLSHIYDKAMGKTTCQTSDYTCKAASLTSIKDVKTSGNRIWEVSMFGYTQWEVWAMYQTPATEANSTINYAIHPLSDSKTTTASIKTWIQKQKDLSQVKFNTAVSTSDIFLTVYTCGTNYDYASANSRIFFFLKAVK